MAPNCLERAIQSVISQDYRDVEHIVMDGGSTDESLQIVDRHRPQIYEVRLREGYWSIRRHCKRILDGYRRDPLLAK